MTIELFPFRYRDARTGKWLHARYRATDAIAELDAFLAKVDGKMQ